MSLYAAVALLGIIAIVQSSVLARLDATAVHPNLMLLTVMAWSLLRGSREGLVWGFAGGLALDLLSGGPLGLNAFLLTLAGYASGFGEARVFRGNALLPALIIVGVTVALFALTVVALAFTGRAVPLADTLWQVLAPSLTLNLIASPLVYRAMRWLSHQVGGEPWGV